MLLLRFSFEIDTFGSTVLLENQIKRSSGTETLETSLFLRKLKRSYFALKKDFQELSLLLSSCFT